jgi:nucleotide-binding universal stress UspA family protein
MPLIITATDFSEVAENAVHYACALALAQNTDLVIIHSYMMPVMLNEVPMPPSLISDAENDAEAEMGALLIKLRQGFPGLNIKGKIFYGDFIDAANEYSDENTGPFLIVLGNGSTEISGSWPDSSLIDALRQIKHAVLAIPPGIVYAPIQKICFAFDNKPVQDAVLEQITGFCRQLNARLYVINAQEDVHTQDHSPDFDPSVKAWLSDLGPHYEMLYETNNVDMAINEFVETNKTDLLVMIARHHSFFERLFAKSHTSSLAHLVALPLLVLHDRK